MLVVVQFPIADLRPFLPRPAQRSRPNIWPPRASIPPQFVHLFGPACPRRKGADGAWLDERIYCSAARAIQFPRLPITQRREVYGDWRSNLRCVFRRLLSDGEAVARVEVGLSWLSVVAERYLWRDWDQRVHAGSDPTAAWTVDPMDVDPLEIVQYVAKIPVSTHRATDKSAVPLVTHTRTLAERYNQATTKKHSSQSWGHVMGGTPVALVECRGHWISRLPQEFVRVDPELTANVNLAFGRVTTSWGPLGVWILGHATASAAQSRRLRLCLLRLHAEQEVLDLVLSRLKDGVIAFDPESEAGSNIQAYLNKATRIIFRNRWAGVQQSAIVTAMDAVNATEYRDVRADLAERLKGARSEIMKKVARFDRRAYLQAPRIKVEVKEMKSINIGAGATIQAPVVIADTIERSFNTLNKQAGLNPEVKALLDNLMRQVTEAAKAMPEKQASTAASDAEALVKEVTGGAPRRKWYELSIEGLRDAAKAVGEVGKPILETTAALLPLLVGLFP